MRTCSRCFIAQSAEFFHKNSGGKDGLQSRCKKCQYELNRTRTHTEESRAKGRESARKRRQDPVKGEHIRELQRLRYHNPVHHEKMKNEQKERSQRPEVKIRNKNHKLKQNFGISWEEREIILARQNGCCAICGITEADYKKSQEGNKRIRGLSVDHCHDSKKNRGLLCSPCNFLLGLVHDNPRTLRSAIKYLKKSQK